jgi:hypothetical protein
VERRGTVKRGGFDGGGESRRSMDMNWQEAFQPGTIVPKSVWFILCAAITAVAWSTFAAPDGDAQSKSTPTCSGSPVASCASAGCHGGGHVGRVGSEQTTWATGDPHANAYRVLFNEESLRITKALRQGDPNRPDAHRDAACLACHSSGTDACFDGQSISTASDGVGCDACHGPSSKWLSRHYEPDWKALTDQQKFDLFGFRQTKDLVSRINACTGCHVGDATREVTHDLIAAGHPRLAFEYTRYHFAANYTKHWAEPLPARDFEIRAWAIGQIASVKAAIDVLHARTAHSNDVRLELAERSCFACHKALTGNNTAIAVKSDWQPWYTALLGVVAEESPTLFSGTAKPNLADVNLLLDEMRKPSPDSSAIKVHSQRASLVLDDWLKAIRRSPATTVSTEMVRKLAVAVCRNTEKESDWDRLAPRYLAAAALRHADGPSLPDWSPPLRELKRRINYPDGMSNPKNFDIGMVHELFRELLRRAE